MRPSLGNARAILGTASILLIAGLIGTYPHPDYRLGATTVLIIAGVFPSLLTIVALVRGGALAQRVAASLSWFPLCWSIVSLPAALILGLNANRYIVVAAMPLQLVVLPLLVFTRDALRVAFLQRIVRLGLAGMLVVWLIASWLFGGRRETLLPVGAFARRGTWRGRSIAASRPAPPPADHILSGAAGTDPLQTKGQHTGSSDGTMAFLVPPRRLRAEFRRRNENGLRRRA